MPGPGLGAVLAAVSPAPLSPRGLGPPGASPRLQPPSISVGPWHSSPSGLPRVTLCLPGAPCPRRRLPPRPRPFWRLLRTVSAGNVTFLIIKPVKYHRKKRAFTRGLRLGANRSNLRLTDRGNLLVKAQQPKVGSLPKGKPQAEGCEGRGLVSARRGLKRKTLRKKCVPGELSGWA